jgi:hypothetical protein
MVACRIDLVAQQEGNDSHAYGEGDQDHPEELFAQGERQTGFLT